MTIVAKYKKISAKRAKEMLAFGKVLLKVKEEKEDTKVIEAKVFGEMFIVMGEVAQTKAFKTSKAFNNAVAKHLFGDNPPADFEVMMDMDALKSEEITFSDLMLESGKILKKRKGDINLEDVEELITSTTIAVLDAKGIAHDGTKEPKEMKPSLKAPVNVKKENTVNTVAKKAVKVKASKKAATAGKAAAKKTVLVLSKPVAKKPVAKKPVAIKAKKVSSPKTGIEGIPITENEIVRALGPHEYSRYALRMERFPLLTAREATDESFGNGQISVETESLPAHLVLKVKARKTKVVATS